MEINGLTVDYASRHIYWTDAQLRKIELSGYDGEMRRVLFNSHLTDPRSILADPKNGYLYWDDQGSRTIERSFLDGSVRETLSSENMTWPNQLALNTDESVLFYVDAWNQALQGISLTNGPASEQMQLSSATGKVPVFGLGVHKNTAYITTWESSMLMAVDLNTREVQTLAGNLAENVLFSVALDVETNTPIQITNPCSSDINGGCSHLCLPSGVFSYRCSCPSFSGLVLAEDALSCVGE
ncbi:hypothetical protein CAPTEDRAFT_111645 [Capitella teleta]|uniref:EGF-like domain-containing protein n=1 Tax=Capitella teleta TaxID=283909 RepID=R7U919_CAPTE|nr:hypothetical protein CAPTEDRAFT_111645 [Capitella teleta]|eukprot:ELU02439.1 hypothetical protein CAPTEDRAFT_111645 [Capitella teleta]